MKRAAFLLVLLLFVGAPAGFAQTEPSGPEKLSDPAQEARAVALQKQFRCLVCRGESLDDSGASLAADLRRLIRARIKAGESDQQIETYLVDRYGDFILMKPPLKSGTVALWFGPFVILLVGGAIAAMVILRAGRSAKAGNKSPPFI
ncbi:MAG: cytochrome c-type biogenesis protein CcmH [Alphaproteobacteria bacterium]|nr:cytochrome c-type biogenesis protein CcmH [Alphaproteobacteria bacterium]